MKPRPIEYLVIGGGPGGTPTAMALASAGKSVMLVKAGLPIEAIAGAIHPHPTLNESFIMAVRAAMAKTDSQAAAK